MQMMVVIPSNREINRQYLSPLLDIGARFIIVDDSEGSISISDPRFQVYNWGHRRDILGAKDEYFPRRNGACRDFGLYMAWRECDDDEVVVALDDDCEITESDFGQGVIDSLSVATRPVFGSGTRHLNILDLYADSPADLFPRGFPYEERKRYVRNEVTHEVMTSAPVFNLGLWTDAFDVNGIDKINGPEWRHPDATLRVSSVAVAPGALVSVCSMNMHMRRKVIPAVFQFPMHIPAMPNWVIDRYGDIWGGFLLKMLVDRRGDTLSVGAPMIGHRKSGDMLRNIWQEHVAHFVNVELITRMAEAAENVEANDYLSMMEEFTGNLSAEKGKAGSMLTDYLDYLCISLQTWCQALREVA
jgi:Reversibly glycosylated polypeptide